MICNTAPVKIILSTFAKLCCDPSTPCANRWSRAYFPQTNPTIITDHAHRFSKRSHIAGNFYDTLLFLLGAIAAILPSTILFFTTLPRPEDVPPGCRPGLLQEVVKSPIVPRLPPLLASAGGSLYSTVIDCAVVERCDFCFVIGIEKFVLFFVTELWTDDAVVHLYVTKCYPNAVHSSSDLLYMTVSRTGRVRGVF